MGGNHAMGMGVGRNTPIPLILQKPWINAGLMGHFHLKHECKAINLLYLWSIECSISWVQRPRHSKFIQRLFQFLT